MYYTKGGGNGGLQKGDKRDLPFEGTALAAVRRVDWKRVRVQWYRVGHAGWRGDRIKTPWGLVGKEAGGGRVLGVGSRVSGAVL